MAQFAARRTPFFSPRNNFAWFFLFITAQEHEIIGVLAALVAVEHRLGSRFAQFELRVAAPTV